MANIWLAEPPCAVFDVTEFCDIAPKRSPEYMRCVRSIYQILRSTETGTRGRKGGERLRILLYKHTVLYKHIILCKHDQLHHNYGSCKRAMIGTGAHCLLRDRLQQTRVAATLANESNSCKRSGTQLLDKFLETIAGAGLW